MVALPKKQFESAYKKFSDMVMPPIHAANVIVSLCFDLKTVDAKLSPELGASLLLDKKIILVVNPGVEVPKKLESLVTTVIKVDANEPEKLVAEIKKFLEKDML
jgi:hypothetical protein